MILLWGLTGDRPLDAVRAALDRRGTAYSLVDQRHVARTSVELCVGAQTAGVVEVDGSRVTLDDVDAVYWRTYDVRSLPSVVDAQDERRDAGRALRHAWAVEDALVSWLELTDALVVNRPSAMASNGSKPFQLEILRAHGFDVPATLVTTDPDEVRRFWTERGAVVYKSVSGARSVVSRLTESHLDRLDRVAWCPTQFQQYVPGQDHRVHVVGDEVIATAVVSDADDYRYAGLLGEPARLRPARLPDDVAERCVAVTRAMGLHLSGVDLRLAPDGRWFAFEVNPSPGFTYYEAHTGQPIADAVAALLASPARTPARTA